MKREAWVKEANLEIMTLLVVTEDMGLGELIQGEVWKERKKKSRKKHTVKGH